MNVTIPEKEKLNKKNIALYIVSIMTCILSIIILAISKNDSKTIEQIISENTHNNVQDEIEEEKLRSEFQKLFQNQLENNYQKSTDKVEEDKDIIYTKYRLEKTEENAYNINVNIPYINIDNEIARKYNEQIEKDFVQKVINIKNEQNTNVIYSLRYEAIIDNEILYLIIYSDLKENLSAQRTIIKTYQYDLEHNKEISLSELINRKGLDKAEIQNKINEKIKEEQQIAESLNNMGYSVFKRNIEDEMYEINNIQNFFVKGDRIYLIFAYGNDHITSEYDIVII